MAGAAQRTDANLNTGGFGTLAFTVAVDGRQLSVRAASGACVADVIEACIEACSDVSGGSGGSDASDGSSTGRPLTARGLRVGSRVLDRGLVLREPWIRNGDVAELLLTRGEHHGPVDPAYGADGLLQLVVSGGPGAGRSYPLTPGEHLIGRDPICDITLSSGSVSGRHAKLIATRRRELRIRDLSSTNGTFVGDAPIGRDAVPLAVGDVVHIGACRLSIVNGAERTPGLGPAAADGRRPFHRAARAATPVHCEPVVVPTVASASMSRPTFNWGALIVPLAMGLVMAALFSPTMALFALLGPLMSVAAYLQETLKLTRQRAAARDTIAQAVEVVTRDVERQLTQEKMRREREHPDPGTVLLRSAGPSGELWQRRVASGNGVLNVQIGRADIAWTPTTAAADPHGSAARPPEVEAILRERPVADVPVTVRLPFGSALGVVADKVTARAIARNVLCQCANLFGPGELKTVVLVELESVDDITDWSWVSLLPHSRQPGALSAFPCLAGRTTEIEALLEDRVRSVSDANSSPAAGPGFAGVRPPHTVHLVVAEMGVLSDNARSLLQRLVQAGTSGGECVTVLALAPSPDLLPSFCGDLLTETGGGTGFGRLTTVGPAESTDEILLALTPVDAALQTALHLSLLSDPDERDIAGGLPSDVSLLPLLGIAGSQSETVRALTNMWHDGAVAVATSLTATLGVRDGSPFVVDLVADGPHGLIGGTTGAGKSELLRSLVASTAATYSPADVNFVLVDYKGGSAFDACAALPHVVGMVTDLDEQLGERALLSLEAELRWREQLLRAANASDFAAYRRSGEGSAVPLARLLVIIDEFATMAKELPDFLSALIGIAQRGRSLGVHMLLATQRPSGVVNENIKANTNIRIALRVQDSGDSHDVIGSPLAASIGRSLPGRAYARLGPSELLAFQSARVPSAAGEKTANTRPTVRVTGSGPYPNGDVGSRPRTTTDDGETIEFLVRCALDAWAETGAVAPRRPWLDPLPRHLAIDRLGSPTGAVEAGDGGKRSGSAGGDGVAIGLLDDPSRQSRRVYTWSPSVGNVAMFGSSGSGSSMALLAVARQLAVSRHPDDVHLYALDFGDGVLGVINTLEHTGSVLAPGERERLLRLLRMLRADVDERRSGDAPVGQPMIVVLVDNIAGVLAALDETGPAARDDFTRLVADGPGSGVFFLVTGDRPGAFPMSLSASFSEKLVFRLADPADVAQFGIDRRSCPPAVAGRALALPGKHAVHIADVTAHDFGSARRRVPDPSTRCRPARPVRSLPTTVGTGEIVHAAMVATPGSAGSGGSAGGGWFLPLGVGDDDLAPVGFVLRPGEHALITAPAHGGKSTALCTVGEVAASAGVVVSLVTPRPIATGRYPGLIDTCVDPRKLPCFLEKIRAHTASRPQLLLVDDAESLDDPSGELVRLATDRLDGLRIVVAARGDALRSTFGHWTSEIRRSRTGLVLRPVPDIDGDLWFTTLPRKGPARFRDGLGYLISAGTTQLVQVASSGTATSTAPRRPPKQLPDR